MMALTSNLNLALAFFLEVALLAILGVWGYEMGATYGWQWPLAIASPLAIAIFWGMFLAPRAVRPVPSALRMMLKIVVFGLGCAALVAIGQVTNAIWFGVTSAINLALLTYWHQ